MKNVTTMIEQPVLFINDAIMFDSIEDIYGVNGADFIASAACSTRWMYFTMGV